MVFAGRHGGDWSGNGVVTSQTLAIAPHFHLTTIATAEAPDVLSYGSGQTASFAGQTVDKTAIIFKYAVAGDMNLNGAVDGDDYFKIDSHFGLSGPALGMRAAI